MQKLLADELIFIQYIYNNDCNIYTCFTILPASIPTEQYVDILNYCNLKYNLKIQTLKLHE